MDILGVVILTTLLAFCLAYTYSRAYVRGYKAGARKVLGEWKQTLDYLGDEDND